VVGPTLESAPDSIRERHMATRVRMTRGKFTGIQAVADQHGVISAAAMDQRGSLKKMISKAKGSPASDAELTEFKVVGTRFLTPYASAILMDPEYGLDAVEAKAPNTGVLLAYEKTGYDATVPGPTQSRSCSTTTPTTRPASTR
jgi:tagatose 1,6-diphosphate aldolase